MSKKVIEDIASVLSIGDELDNGYVVIDGPANDGKRRFLFKCRFCGERKWLDQYWATQSKHAYCAKKKPEFLPNGSVVGEQVVIEQPQRVRGKLRYRTRCNTCLHEFWRTVQTVERKDLRCIECKARAQKIQKPDLERGRELTVQSIKSNARTRGLEFALTKHEALELVSSDCYYCGSPPEPRHPKGINTLANGIDRVDSSLGYTNENTVSCCSMCNIGKWNKDAEEFLQWIKRVYEHNRKDKNEC